MKVNSDGLTRMLEAYGLRMRKTSSKSAKIRGLMALPEVKDFCSEQELEELEASLTEHDKKRRRKSSQENEDGEEEDEQEVQEHVEIIAKNKLIISEILSGRIRAREPHLCQAADDGWLMQDPAVALARQMLAEIEVDDEDREMNENMFRIRLTI